MSYTTNRQLSIYAIIAVIVLATAGIAWGISVQSGQKNASNSPVALQQTSSFSTKTLMATGTLTPSSGGAISRDGSYQVTQKYRTPEGTSAAVFAITISNGLISQATTTYQSGDRESQKYVSLYNAGFGTATIGKSLKDIDEVYISGASLTSAAFDQALVSLKQQAQ
jgi:major membrane immunogen (membrane-anchored lipoprotein)